MKLARGPLALLVAFALAPSLLQGAARSIRTTLGGHAAPEARARATLARLPLRFEANAGQLDASVRYAARAEGVSLFLTDEGATLAVSPRAGDAGHEARAGAAVTMRVVGRTRTQAPVPSERMPTRSSYFVGSDPAGWRTDVPSYRRVAYDDVLPGVRQLFHGEAGALEYDFVLAPGARPESIEVAFDGADSVTLDARGDLAVHTPAGDLRQPRPRVYQREAGEDLAVAAGYRVTGRVTVAFDIGPYDTSRALVIDPVLAYSTFLGGSGSDFGYGIAVDGEGAMYVTGFTSSPDFPTTHPHQATLRGPDDVFVAKLSPDGTELVYSTTIGGTDGAYGYGIAVDAAGAAYVVGSTVSADYPTTAGAFQTAFGGISDAVVTKLSPSGSSLVYSTYLGGVDRDYGYGIAVDGTGAAFVVGKTIGLEDRFGNSSDDFPTVAGGAQTTFGGGTDAFVAKVSPSGSSLVYSTYVGGSADDEGAGIALDRAGAAYVTGFTSSLDFPTAPATPYQALNNGTDNAFVTKLSPTGSAFVYSTYLGGAQVDEAAAIAVDGVGAAYVTGTTSSPDFPTLDAYQAGLASLTGGTTGFVTKLAPSGTSLSYSTFLGGSGGDYGTGIAVDASGDAFVTGTTSSVDFPTASAFQPLNEAAHTQETNAFVTELAPTGSTLVYSTYLGGSVGDAAQGIALGTAAPADVYVVGFTVSPDFPTEGALQPDLASAGGDNAFVAVFGGALLAADAGPVERAFANDAGRDAGTDAPSGLDAAEPHADASAVIPPTVGGSGCACSMRGRGAGGDTGGPVVAMIALGLAGLGRRRRRGLLPR